MSALGLLDKLAGGTVERMFGETVTISPQIGARHAGYGGADPARPARTIKAAFASGTDATLLFGARRQGHSAVGNTEVVTTNSVLSVTAATYATLGYEVVKDDFVTVRGTVYRVVVARLDDVGAVLVELVPK